MKRAVVDQPGFKIIILGFVLSLMVGLLIKGQISPKKMKNKIDQAISKLDPDLKIDFKSIEIKLSDWGWPQPYLEIHDIRMSPVKSLCDESQVFVDTVSFPLTWNLIFESKKIIKSLRINQLEIRLSEFKNCFSATESKSVESTLNSALQQVFTAHNSGQLEDLKIDRIKILSKGNYQSPLFLQAAVFNFTYADQMLSDILLKAQISSHRDESKNMFKLRSDLSIHIFKKDKNDVFIEGQASGKIIDRKYDVHFYYDLLLNRFVFNANLDKIAIKTLLKFLNFENNSNVNILNTYFSNYFLSLDGAGFFDLNDNQMTQFKVKNILIESQNTFLNSKNMIIESLNPLQIAPGAEFQIANYDLKSFFNENIKHDILLNNTVQFGKFTGQFKSVSDHQTIVAGQISDFEFNLKYNNENWPQKINSADIKFKSTNSDVDIVMSKIILNQQPIVGQINYETNSENIRKYNAQLSGELFSPAFFKNIFGSEQKNNFNLNINNRNSDHPSLNIKTDSIQWDNAKTAESDKNKNLINIFEIIFEQNRQKTKLIPDADESLIKALKNIEINATFMSPNTLRADIFLKNKKNEIYKLLYDVDQQVFTLEQD